MKNVLVVDDEKHVVDIVKLILEKEGCKVIPAYSGEECLKKAGEQKPDLILLDIMMPEMDGWTVLDALKKDKKSRDIPVAMLTVKKQILTDNALKKSGVVAYITKSFVREDFVKRVKKILEE